MSEFTPPPPPAGSSGPGGGGFVYPTTPPKDPMVVLLLNLFLGGGVGYIIMGQKTKGIVTIVAWIVCVPITWCAGSFAIAVIAAIDGYQQAQQLQQGHPVGEWTFFSDHK